eukprot:scaffold380711_cov36-Prasinocladus_malaysianus.AAC.1
MPVAPTLVPAGRWSFNWPLMYLDACTTPQPAKGCLNYMQLFKPEAFRHHRMATVHRPLIESLPVQRRCYRS